MVSIEPRDASLLFSPGRIGTLALANRLVRSATWDPDVVLRRTMDSETVEIYDRLAAGGVGLIIAGDFSVVPAAGRHLGRAMSYDEVRIEGFDRLPKAVRQANPRCRIVAQVSGSWPGMAPSPIGSPYGGGVPQEMTSADIEALADAYAVAIAGVRDDGFDGVQLHAAHGGPLGRFLSPAWNHRTDAYGGSAEGRCRVIREIVARARRRVGDFPILIKVNGTDYLEGGIDQSNFPALAAALAATGIDALEVSGGTWEALLRPPSELPFPRVPSAESQTRLSDPRAQSYFLPYAEAADVDIPVILVGGHRDRERIEAILQQGSVDFVALCRPLLREPELPNRWRSARGSQGVSCVSCNACLADMYDRLDRGEPRPVRCMVVDQPERLGEMRIWLETWVERFGPRATASG